MKDFCFSISDHLRRIRTVETDRSLVELTGDKDVFLNLHKYFVFLLKAGGQRVIEVVLEGPPPVMAKAEPSRSASVSGPDEDIWQTLDRPVTAPEFSVVTGLNDCTPHFCVEEGSLCAWAAISCPCDIILSILPVSIWFCRLPWHKLAFDSFHSLLEY